MIEQATVQAATTAPAINLATIISWILTLMTALIGIWRFSVEQRQANRRPFLEKQLELCFEATDTAARLATETDLGEWEKSRLNFWRLYWGPLSIVEDPKVEGAMVALGRLVPHQRVEKNQLPMKSLSAPSYELAHTVRDLVLAGWKIDLPHLERQRLQSAD